MLLKNVRIMPKGAMLMTTAELMNERERETLSPFAALELLALEKPSTLPPRRIIADSKLNLVRVLGS